MKRRGDNSNSVEDQLCTSENSPFNISKEEEKLLILIAEILVKFITTEDYGKNSVRPGVSETK
ncbi:hypothetical protein MUB18_20510 [Sphingobacterium sp. PCS056]|uniref:hypothetical protein n=1 Tax=Sphingobacterium sp. PCS056 TaxID=2931400 RepID=UPI00200E312F|nr:hypothetical protein [Sphingobacterium sp. PCS056]UPZ36471.1 hypothetical protein MUB18_20510 [Sphingobacterium sp. PCS056]